MSEKLYTLAEAKAFLEANMEEGCKCPACGQNVKINKYSISDKTAKSLINLHKLTLENPSQQYFHVERDIEVPLSVGGSWARLRHFYLIEEKPKSEEDKGRTSGYWRITDYGRKFVNNQLPLKKYVHIFNKTVKKYSGKKVTITDCLGQKFDYDELMSR